MKKTFIYWDNSSMFIGDREVAIEHEGELVRFRVCVHYQNLFELAQAGRPLGTRYRSGPSRQNCAMCGIIRSRRESPKTR